MKPYRVTLIAITLFGMSISSAAWCQAQTFRLSQYAHTAWRTEDGLFNGMPGAVA
jgi:hypothetical protein